MNTLTTYIGNKIKELRSAVGMTQSALAAELEVTPHTVSRWEGAVNQPSVVDLERIARTLHRPIWAFLPSELAPPTDEQKALLSATGDLPAEDLEELTAYAEFVRARRALRAGKKKSG